MSLKARPGEILCLLGRNGAGKTTTLKSIMGIVPARAGSITLDGISLTVVDPDSDSVGVAVIPHTASVTTLGHKGVGDALNVEVDVMAKHAERLLAGHLPES